MLDSSRIKKAEALFAEMIALPGPRRQAELELRCSGDPQTARLVRRLLEHDDSGMAGFLAAPAGAAPTWQPLPDNTRVGNFQLLRRIGEGGMGIVYEARQLHPERNVALKVIRGGRFVDQYSLKLFQREVQALARLRHPCIGAIYEAGGTDDEQNYFAMELVEGRPLMEHVRGGADAHCGTGVPRGTGVPPLDFGEDKAGEDKAGEVKAPALSFRERLTLFRQICDAIHYAHQRGVMHRDLKPSNILIDAHGTPRILDFGLARITDTELGIDVSRTAHGRIQGTLAYMSPEQARGDSAAIDIRSDVYSLGVILYELLTDRLPYDVMDLPLPRAVETICNQPPQPSASLKGDLETITLRALEKEPQRRYASAAALGDDLQRFLANQPIEAKRDSTWYVLRKALARHRVAASIAAAFVALISVSAVALAILYQRQFRAREAEVTQRLRAEQEADRANREADRAVQERNKTESFAQFMEETLRGVGPSVALGRDTRMLKELMDAAAKRIEDGELRDIPGAELRLRDSIGNVYREIADFDAAERMLLPALDLAERMHGRNSLEYAAAVRNHAGWLIAKARLAEALPKSEAALAIRRRLLPPDHRDIASSLNDVAVCMQALGRTPEALPKLEAALDMWQRVMPGDHDEVAMTLNNLGDCHQMLGRFAEALPRFEGALAMWQRLHPGDHPNVAFGLNNVGHCLRFMGRSAEALPKNAAALDMYQRLFPGDHPNVSVSLLNVANCLTSLGRPAEALTKSVAALEMLQRLFPGDHRDVATAMNHVAMSLASLDRPTEALPKYEAALEMWQRIFHGDHPQVAAGMNNLARCLVELNRHTEALPKYEASLEMWQRLHPDGHPESVTVLNNLGICLKSLDRPAEALAKHEAALAICKRVLPASHQSVAFSEVAAGAALVDLDRLEGAETLLLKGYTALSDKPGAAARYRKLALEALVKFYNARHAAQPGNGFDAKADEYRRMLAAIAP